MPLRAIWLFERGQWDGPTSAARQMGVALLRKGVRIATWFREGGPVVDEFRRAGLEPAIYPHYGRFILGRSATAAGRAFGATVVHAHSGKLAPAAARLARDLDARAFVTVHHMDAAENEGLAGVSGLTVIAVSDAIQERLANVYGVPPSRLHVVVDCLDLREYARPSFTPPPDEDRHERAFVIGSWGRLAEVKGQRVLLRAAALLVAGGLDVEALLLGDGPDRVALRSLGRELGIESRVTFAPFSHAGTLNDLDILVEPSFREGFGLSALQAMALGVPVVASGVGGLFALVKDRETGLMVPPGDPQALAQAVGELLRNPSLRRELARNARDRVESDFDADQVSLRLLALYRG